MKVTDIATQNGFNVEDFENFLKNSNANVKTISRFGFATAYLEDDIDRYVNLYKSILYEQQRRIEAELWEKQKALGLMMITSGFHFEGYKITRYVGYISGDATISIKRGRDGFFVSGTNIGEDLSKVLVKIRRDAIQELKEQAYKMGCNAIIGMDFDYITLDSAPANTAGNTSYLPYVFCVTANGNAVVIEEDN